MNVGRTTANTPSIVASDIANNHVGSATSRNVLANKPRIKPDSYV